MNDKKWPTSAPNYEAQISRIPRTLAAANVLKNGDVRGQVEHVPNPILSIGQGRDDKRATPMVAVSNYVKYLYTAKLRVGLL